MQRPHRRHPRNHNQHYYDHTCRQQHHHGCLSRQPVHPIHPENQTKHARAHQPSPPCPRPGGRRRKSVEMLRAPATTTTPLPPPHHNYHTRSGRRHCSADARITTDSTTTSTPPSDTQVDRRGCVHLAMHQPWRAPPAGRARRLRAGPGAAGSRPPRPRPPRTPPSLPTSITGPNFVPLTARTTRSDSGIPMAQTFCSEQEPPMPTTMPQTHPSHPGQCARRASVQYHCEARRCLTSADSPPPVDCDPFPRHPPTATTTLFAILRHFRLFPNHSLPCKGVATQHHDVGVRRADIVSTPTLLIWSPHHTFGTSLVFWLGPTTCVCPRGPLPTLPRCTTRDMLPSPTLPTCSLPLAAQLPSASRSKISTSSPLVFSN